MIDLFVGVVLTTAAAVKGTDATLILGSFGASAVLLYGAPAAPFSQPRNVIGGHILSAGLGASSAAVLPPEVAAPAAVSLSLMAMMGTKTVHPPAGGTALIAVMGGAHIQQLGLFYVAPAGLGACVLVGTAAAINRAAGRQYPQQWL